MLDTFRKPNVISFIFLGFLAFFFFGFYFTTLPSSRHSAGIRYGILILIILLFTNTNLKSTSEAFRFQFLKMKYSIKVFIGILLLFFIYFIARAFGASDYSEGRAVLVLALFIAATSWFLVFLKLKIDKVVFALGILGFLVGIAFLLQNIVFGEHPLSAEPLRLSVTGYAWLASYENTIIAGLFFSYLLLASAWSYFNSKTLSFSIIYYFGCALLLFAIFNTAARTAWIASAASLATLLIFNIIKNKRKTLALYSPLFVTTILYIFTSFKNIVREGLTYRDLIWVEHLQSMHGLRDWLFGKGLSANMGFVELPNGIMAVHSHSIYIEILYIGGTIGLGLFILMLLSMFYNLIKLPRSNTGISFVLTILAGGVVAMAFDFSEVLGHPNLLWLWLWFPVSFSIASMINYSACRVTE